MRVIISGGGTGGHIFPAIAVAQSIKVLEPKAEILFVGAKGKMEMDIVPKAGFSIEGLWISGFQRRLTLKNISFPFKLVHSWINARKIIKRFRPDVVLGFGGYASGPILNAAVNYKIPTLIQEQNSYAGVTNRILSKDVDVICVAYPEMDKYFPKNKIHYTGNPVRKDIINVDDLKDEAYKFLNLDPNKKTISILGGSLGAKSLNESVKNNSSFLEMNNNIQIIWQMGKLYESNYANCVSAKLQNVKPMTFIERMDYVYAVSDIVIARAGALTVSELCLAKKAAILVPSTNVAEDHQTKNANVLHKKNAAIVVKDINSEQLIKNAIELSKNERQLQELSAEIAKLAKPNAADDIAKLALSIVKKK